ncbi:outer membrane beta-barrel protein [Ruegeria sp.]|uniref:outer membrane protein n=1 Tax=Ruegeria sp. TaxID=1879320 RepID=UPI002325BC79|nr:outer membrane beta-barrel protein [Ruegeria sp.]MDA7964664.1 outer membrane beta-barrel protein [Ruegeria sp.]
MSRVFSAMVIAVLSAVPTLAGDVIGDVTEPDIIAPQSSTQDASAFYLGVSGGYASGGSDEFGLRTAGGLFSIGDVSPNGAYGGIRGGWRGILPARVGRDFVYGVEVGYDFGTLDDSSSTVIMGIPVTAGSSISDVLSVRLRSGLRNRNSSILYFGTIGYVQGDIMTSASITGGGAFQVQDRRNGFSASLGAEHQLNKNWSITGEIEYVQFESRTIDLGGGFSTKSTPSFTGLRFGLNYTF